MWYDAAHVPLQVSWLYVIPADVYELIHNSLLKVMRAVQTVAKFLVEVSIATTVLARGLRTHMQLTNGDTDWRPHPDKA